MVKTDMRSRDSVRRELTRVKQALHRSALGSAIDREQYGAMQALEWVLRNNAAAPSTLVPTSERVRAQRSGRESQGPAPGFEKARASDMLRDLDDE